MFVTSDKDKMDATEPYATTDYIILQRLLFVRGATFSFRSKDTKLKSKWFDSSQGVKFTVSCRRTTGSCLFSAESPKDILNFGMKMCSELLLSLK